eukprot:2540643-Amphidinium_carterae.1
MQELCSTSVDLLVLRSSVDLEVLKAVDLASTFAVSATRVLKTAGPQPRWPHDGLTVQAKITAE